jgi:AAA family ATP:ADP antiporter
MAIYPLLSIIRVMKIAENSTDYSINNTAKQVLWLPVTREMKYRAKAAVDTIFVRLGDGFAALTAFVGMNLLDVGLRALFAFNALIVVLWLALAILVVRERGRWVRRRLGIRAAPVRTEMPSPSLAARE